MEQIKSLKVYVYDIEMININLKELKQRLKETEAKVKKSDFDEFLIFSDKKAINKYEEYLKLAKKSPLQKIFINGDKVFPEEIAQYLNQFRIK